MPDFPIVDSHVHLFDTGRLRYPWLAGVPAIDRPHLMGDFDAARGAVEVEALVFVEVDVDTGLHLDEAAFVGQLAASDRRIRGMVAHLPVERGKIVVEPDLEIMARDPILRGIRRLIEVERDPTICLEPHFVEGVQAVGRHGLVFDLCLKNWALPFATELARRCPDVQFVLDHIGKPGIRLGLRDPWWDGLKRIAALGNVACKLSGVITEADHANWTAAQVTPYVAHAIECFGFDRLMYGSDWPVSSLTHAYPVWVEILDGILAGCDEAQRRAVFRDTAMRVYRLG